MNEKPKVLIVGVDAWRKDSGSNTMANVFRCWDSSKVALVYTRSDYPDADGAMHYYRISENRVMHSVFRPWIKPGAEVDVAHHGDCKDAEQEHRRYARAHKKHSFVMTVCREIVWFLGRWKQRELIEFVDKFSPDVLFFPVFNTWYMNRLELFLAKKAKKPYVVYYFDDDYSYKACQGLLSYVHRFILRKYVKRLIVGAKEVFTINSIVKREIDQLFDKNSFVLSKGVDLTNAVFQKTTVHKPVRFVYTGNLLIGRNNTLLKIASILQELDPLGEKTRLDVYTQTEISNEEVIMLNKCPCHFNGRISREHIDDIQNEADILVFIEAIEGKNAYIARMSFSTKLTDYFEKGKCIFAVGKRDTAPIEYLSENDAAIVATNEDEIRRNIERIISTPAIIEDYGRAAFECAVSNHNKIDQDRVLTSVLCGIYEGTLNED